MRNNDFIVPTGMTLTIHTHTTPRLLLTLLFASLQRPIAGFSFGNWISDSAHILSPAAASRINAELEELKAETG